MFPLAVFQSRRAPAQMETSTLIKEIVQKPNKKSDMILILKEQIALKGITIKYEIEIIVS